MFAESLIEFRECYVYNVYMAHSSIKTKHVKKKTNKQKKWTKSSTLILVLLIL